MDHALNISGHKHHKKDGQQTLRLPDEEHGITLKLPENWTLAQNYSAKYTQMQVT